MSDADVAGVELQNQAASLEEVKKEERDFRDLNTIKEKATALGGQLIVRFTNGTDTCFKVVSAHIAK